MLRVALSRLSGFGILLLILSGCAGPQVPLVGTVTDAYTGEPVTGAKVMVGETELTTSAEGRFEASAWSSEDAVVVAAPGYEGVTIPLAELPQLQQPTPPAATFDTALRPNTLRGVVSDLYSGKPLAGATVTVAGAEGSAVTAGADGSYTLENLPENFSVEITAPGYASVSRELARSTSFDASLRPNVLSGKLADAATGAPIVGANVTFGKSSATTTSDGSFRLEDVPEQGTFSADAEGYAATETSLERATSYDAELRPDQIRATLLDAGSGKPVPHATVIVRERLDATASAQVRIDGQKDGVFVLDGMPEQGYLHVLAPGYKRLDVAIKDGKLPAELSLEPFQMKAVYITAGIASAGVVDEYLDFIDRTELNTLVIDLKSDMRDDLGLVYYDSQVPLAKELGIAADFVDMQAIVDEAKKRGIYTVARVQLFSHDNALADARPEWAIQDITTGKPYSDFPGPGIRYTWLDATNRNVWEYNIQLGEEAALMGFDEVNYDYIRFPDNPSSDYEDFRFSQQVHPEKNPEAMFETIIGFMDEAHDRVNAAGAFMSVDVFGRTVIKASLPIAQDIALMVDHADYVMPMIYPSLWWGGFADLELPAAQPYETIAASLKYAEPKFVGKYGKLRPWLQDHTDPWQAVVVEYGPAEVRAQIQAVKDFDPTMGWILYNSANVYTEEALARE